VKSGMHVLYNEKLANQLNAAIGKICYARIGKRLERGVVVGYTSAIEYLNTKHVQLMIRLEHNKERVLVDRDEINVSRRTIRCGCGKHMATIHISEISVCDECDSKWTKSDLLGVPTYENGLDNSGSMSPQQYEDIHASISKAIETSTDDHVPIVWRNVNDGIDKSLGALNAMRNSAGLSDTVIPSTHPSFRGTKTKIGD
jgi:hypothetical protein